MWISLERSFWPVSRMTFNHLISETDTLLRQSLTLTVQNVGYPEFRTSAVATLKTGSGRERIPSRLVGPGHCSVDLNQAHSCQRAREEQARASLTGLDVGHRLGRLIAFGLVADGKRTAVADWLLDAYTDAELTDRRRPWPRHLLLRGVTL